MIVTNVSFQAMTYAQAHSEMTIGFMYYYSTNFSDNLHMLNQFLGVILIEKGRIIMNLWMNFPSPSINLESKVQGKCTHPFTANYCQKRSLRDPDVMEKYPIFLSHTSEFACDWQPFSSSLWKKRNKT